ncbi:MULTISPECIES: hypothetical protein [Gammaproteobacteria]|jgi:hypothetical protein|uniref:hypothetical protein n=1 Tax=Gammaproteobacteria TaxID=1236 RepID=UPI00112EB98D|nr:hypothetical protein [Pseudomonas sp. Hp2]
MARIWTLLLGIALVQPLWAAELEEERVNPSEVTFEKGVPVYYEGGRPVRLKTRQEGGETIYYRLVRYDAQEGYVDQDGRSIAADGNYVSPQTPIRGFAAGRASSRVRYYGAGLYGPDYYQSPYNRDARKHYSGPGYYGSCDWRGCREVHYLVPVYGYPY